jgi:glycosyltransferase involved in cell wall biosynthesis
LSDSAVKVLCVTGHPDRPEAATFAGLAARGFNVRVLCAPDAPTIDLLEASGATIIPFTIRHRFDRDAVATIRRELADFRPDVLHLFNNQAVLNGLRAAKGSDVRIVAYRGNVGNVNVLDPLAWLRYLNPRIDRIVCVSDAVKDYLGGISACGWRLPRERLVTIRKGHSLSWYTQPPPARATLGIPDDAFVVGCVANWRPRKGVEVLLDACADVPHAGMLHVALVGNMHSPGLEKTIAAHPLRERIHVLGHRKDAAAVAGAFDVAVLPAIKREGLPKTVIESMAYGVATIASRVGGVPEIIEHGVSGLIVEPGDAAALAAAIEKLHGDRELRLSLGRAGRERIARALRIEDTIAQTKTLYRELVGR